MLCAVRITHSRALAADVPTIPDTAALRAVADQLGQVLATGDPDRTKALLRTLIAELHVNSRSEILPTYRVGAPVVCAQTSSVARTGIEPVISLLARTRGHCAWATSCPRDQVRSLGQEELMLDRTNRQGSAQGRTRGRSPKPRAERGPLLVLRRARRYPAPTGTRRQRRAKHCKTGSILNRTALSTTGAGCRR
jgi:hypothetical protein